MRHGCAHVQACANWVDALAEQCQWHQLTGALEGPNQDYIKLHELEFIPRDRGHEIGFEPRLESTNEGLARILLIPTGRGGEASLSLGPYCHYTVAPALDLFDHELRCFWDGQSVGGES